MTQLELPMEMPEVPLEKLMELFIIDSGDGIILNSLMYRKWMAGCHDKEISKS